MWSGVKRLRGHAESKKWADYDPIQTQPRTSPAPVEQKLIKSTYNSRCPIAIT